MCGVDISGLALGVAALNPSRHNYKAGGVPLPRQSHLINGQRRGFNRAACLGIDDNS